MSTIDYCLIFFLHKYHEHYSIQPQLLDMKFDHFPSALRGNGYTNKNIEQYMKRILKVTT